MDLQYPRGRFKFSTVTARSRRILS
uniref:Uncharacterized protein n=1 Tax=Timema genevievae TaxID=629358 RepID=A0A7R9KAZ8_TIMGE|nr:unnamed protein product [Timema genevievae]